MEINEKNKNSSMVMHWYPEYIINPIHINRSVKIIVKETPTNMKGAWDVLVNEAIEKQSEFSDIIDSSGNLWALGEKVSDIDTTRILENTKKIQKGDPIYACCLPLPNEFLDSQNHNWQADQSLISEFANSFVDKNIGIGNYSASSNKIAANAAHYFGFRKPMVDPGLFQNYSGSTPRGFSMNFDFVPNNEIEAKSIMNIILNLKKFSLPRSVIDGVALLAPFTFEIEIGNEWMKKLINMNDVVITGVTTNYGADGGMQLFSNGVPKHITLQLDFAERSLLPAQFYD